MKCVGDNRLSDKEMRAYEQVDRTRSVSQMKAKLVAMPPVLRGTVILHALRTSRHQFTWSWLARSFGVDRSAWPRPPVTAEDLLP
jgi:hypothetical protein